MYAAKPANHLGLHYVPLCTEAHTMIAQHTNYIHLTPDEKDERMKNLHQSL